MSNQNTTPIVGLPHATGWSQVVDIAYSDITLVIAYSLRGNHASDMGKRIAQEIIECKPKDAQELYTLIIDLHQQCNTKDIFFSVSAGLFTGDTATVFCLNSSILLGRGDQVGVLLTADSESKLTVGQHYPSDVFVFATQCAESWFTTIKRKMELKVDTDTIITALVPEIHRLDDSSLHAFAFFSAQQQSEKQSKKSRTFWSVLGRGLSALARYVWLFSRQLRTLFIFAFSKQEYLGKRRQRKRMIQFLVIVSLIFMFSGFFWYKQRQNELEIVAAEQFVDTYVDRRVEIADAALLDPIQAREDLQLLLTETQQQLEKLDLGSKKREFLESETQREQELLEQISGKDEFAELQTYYDLRLIDSTFVATKVASDGERSIFVDGEKKTAVLLILAQKKAVTIDLSQLDQVVDTALTPTSVLFLSGNSGIWEFPFAEEGELELIIADGDSNRDASLLMSFDPYVYVFNSAKRNIFRYVPEDDGYSEPIGWLIDKKGIVFSDIVTVAIDGDVWLSDKNGTIQKLSSGEQVDFTVSGLSDPFTSSIILDTHQDLNRVFILEAEKNRVVILTKEGEFFREIKSQAIGAVTDIFVAKDGSRLFAVSGSLIYSIPLVETN